MRARWLFIKRKRVKQEFVWALEDPTTLEFLKMEIIDRHSYLSIRERLALAHILVR